jgi:hypothetical protein
LFSICPEEKGIETTGNDASRIAAMASRFSICPEEKGIETVAWPLLHRK